MGRESIVDDAERNRHQSTAESEQGSDADPAGEDETGNDRKRTTLRIPRDLLADVDAVEEQYALPSRNAAINFILKQGTNNLLDDRGRP